MSARLRIIVRTSHSQAGPVGMSRLGPDPVVSGLSPDDGHGEERMRHALSTRAPLAITAARHYSLHRT